MRERAGRGKTKEGWEEQKNDFLGRKEWRLEEVEVLRERGELRGEDLRKKERKLQRKERWSGIRESKFHK